MSTPTFVRPDDLLDDELAPRQVQPGQLDYHAPVRQERPSITIVAQPPSGPTMAPEADVLAADQDADVAESIKSRLKAAKRAWDEADHPRAPRGSGDKSGEFVSKGARPAQGAPGARRGPAAIRGDVTSSRARSGGTSRDLQASRAANQRAATTKPAFVKKGGGTTTKARKAEKTPGGIPYQKTVLPPAGRPVDHGPGRSAQGNLRNYKAMTDERLADLVERMRGSKDAEAVAAVRAEVMRRLAERGMVPGGVREAKSFAELSREFDQLLEFGASQAAAVDAVNPGGSQEQRTRRRARQERERKSKRAQSWDEGKHPRAKAGSPVGGQFIKVGSKGDRVRAVQARVGVKNPDGSFDAQTRKLVREFQRRHGITVDGVVGRQTIRAMAGDYAGARRTKTGSLSASDLAALDRIAARRRRRR